jgi:hypothetical protein
LHFADRHRKTCGSNRQGNWKWQRKEVPSFIYQIELFFSEVIEFAKKNALTDARKAAFQKISLVVLESGKVAVHFLEEEEEE